MDAEQIVLFSFASFGFAGAFVLALKKEKATSAGMLAFAMALAMLGFFDPDNIRSFKKTGDDFELVIASQEKQKASLEIAKEHPNLSPSSVERVTNESRALPTALRTDADYLVLAMDAFRNGNADDELRYAQLGLSAPPSSDRVTATLIHRKASAFDSLGLPEKAIELYLQAGEKDRQFTWPHNNRGVILRRLGRFDESLAAFDRALELDATYGKGHIGRGDALRSLGRYDEAFAAYDRAIQLDPTFARGHLARGIALHRMERYEEALAAYDRARELEPNSRDGHAGRGDSLRSLGRHDEALAAYDRAIQLDPNYSNGHLGRGIVVSTLGRYDEALAAYEKALELDPENVIASEYRERLLARP